MRCYNGNICHDADPWTPDDNMRLDIPNHRIDMSKPLRDQPWLGDHSIPTAVPCITKALCICDVLFGYDGHKQSAPVGAVNPFVIPDDMLSLVDAIKPTRPGTCVPKSKNGKSESTIQQTILWLDNYYPLYHRWRPLAYMGLPRDAVEVEDFNYEDLLYR